MKYLGYNFKRKKQLEGQKAIALRYGESVNEAATVIATWKEEMAEKIIDMAKKKGVPIQEDSKLIANLIDMDLGENIPPQLYSVIAEIMIVLEEIERNL
jgi:flagellar biosynthesis protein